MSAAAAPTTIGSIDTTGVFAAINREIALLKSRYARKAYCDDSDGCHCGHPCAGTDCHACCDDMRGNWVCDSCDLTYCGDECLPIGWRTTLESRDSTYCSSCDEIRLSYGQVNYYGANLWDEYRFIIFKHLRLIKALKALKAAGHGEVAEPAGSVLTAMIAGAQRTRAAVEERITWNEEYDAEAVALSVMDAAEHAAGLRRTPYDGEDSERYDALEREIHGIVQPVLDAERAHDVESTK